MLRRPLEAELAAASSAAAKAGLGFVVPEVLHLGNHTSVRLTPGPVVARIASGTSFDFSHGPLGRELAIASHLASREAPAVRPISDVSPGPYLVDGCAVTLWEFVDGRSAATKVDEFMAATSLRQIHSALANFVGELPSFITKVESCETILTDPAQTPQLGESDRLFLQRVYAVLRTDLEGMGGAWQPLHGDTHLGNVLITASGAIWMDLEAACLGPIEWDVVNLPVATWSAFVGIDLTMMRLLAKVRSLCVAVWCWAEYERSAATAEAAIYHLHQLKRRFNKHLQRIQRKADPLVFVMDATIPKAKTMPWRTSMPPSTATRRRRAPYICAQSSRENWARPTTLMTTLPMRAS